MNDETYTISQAAQLVGEKDYVLRYWEEELALQIGRNQMGHRCYTGYDIQLFMNIKELKKRGLKLVAIKEMIPGIYQQAPGTSHSKVKLLPGDVPPAEENTHREASRFGKEADEKMYARQKEYAKAATEKKSLVKPSVEKKADEGPAAEKKPREAFRNSTAQREAAAAREPVKAAPGPVRSKEQDRLQEFQLILEKLIAQGLRQKNQEEARCTRLDEAIRFHQETRRQAAASRDQEKKYRKKKRLLKKKTKDRFCEYPD